MEYNKLIELARLHGSHEEWDKILNRMIFLWREADEDTCTMMNPHEKEFEKTSAEFIQNWIQKKQQETYVHIDPKWRGCDFQYPGWVHEDNE